MAYTTYKNIYCHNVICQGVYLKNKLQSAFEGRAFGLVLGNKRPLRECQPPGVMKGNNIIGKTIMLINKIQYHKVICQDVFKQGERTRFRAKRKPLEDD